LLSGAYSAAAGLCPRRRREFTKAWSCHVAPMLTSTGIAASAHGLFRRRALDEDRSELIGKAVVLTDGKAGTVEGVWLDEHHGLRISIGGHDGKWPFQRSNSCRSDGGSVRVADKGEHNAVQRAGARDLSGLEQVAAGRWQGMNHPKVRTPIRNPALGIVAAPAGLLGAPSLRPFDLLQEAEPNLKKIGARFARPRVPDMVRPDPHGPRE
jgi:hypothetical protein